LNQQRAIRSALRRTDTWHTAQLPDQFLQQTGIFYLGMDASKEAVQTY